MDLGRYQSKSVSNKDFKEPVMASSSEERTCHLGFSFVPATGTLPSQVLVEKDQLPKILISQEGAITKKSAEYEKNLEMKKTEHSERFLDAIDNQRSGDSFSKEKDATNSLEEIKHNDLFIAEFVVVMDSDDGEDGSILKKTEEEKDYDTRAQRSTITQPKELQAAAFVKKIGNPEAQHEFSHGRVQQYLNLPNTDVNNFQSTDLSQGLSKYTRNRSPYVPVNVTVNTENIYTFPKRCLSQESNYFNVSTHNAQPPKSVSSVNHSQVQRQLSPPGKCARTNTLSPLPIKIIKHPLSTSPSPLHSQLFGSSSTICSINDSPSPVPRAESTSRLSFLTSLLKSKKLPDRTTTPEPGNYHSGVRSSLQFQGASSPPRKSQSCFALNYPKEFLNAPAKNKTQIQPPASEIVHSEPSFHSPSPRCLSPESVPLKSSPGSLFSRKGAMSPRLEFPHQSSTLLNSSREKILTLNEKPPLNKQAYTPLKKYSILGKSRRVTLFPPPSPFHQSSSSTINQKLNVTPYVKQYVPVKSNLRQSYSLSENLDGNHARSVSPMEFTESCRFPSSYTNTCQLYNNNADLECDISPSLYSSYAHHSESFEELSGDYTPICTSPTNILGSPRSYLSSSCELRSPSSLSQSENKQSYKVKSNYKSFAAIPTNTLLQDQKAIDKPRINTTAIKENLDPHHEMCSPALLRQQTEEICAVIDEVLHDDPLPMHYKAVSKPVIRKREPKSPSILRSSAKSAGRETKYASIQHPANTRTHNPQKTRPGVIRPISIQISIENMDGLVSPYEFL